MKINILYLLEAVLTVKAYDINTRYLLEENKTYEMMPIYVSQTF